MLTLKLKTVIKIAMIITLVSGQCTWATTPQSPIETRTMPQLPYNNPNLEAAEMQALGRHLSPTDLTIIAGHLQNSMNKLGETRALSDYEIQQRLASGVAMYQALGSEEADQLQYASNNISMVRVALKQMQDDELELIEAVKSGFRNPEFLEMNGLGDSAGISPKQCRGIASEDEYGPIPKKPDGTNYQRPPLNQFKIWLEKKVLPENRSSGTKANCLAIYSAMTAALLAASFLIFVWGPVVAIPVAILAIPLTIWGYYLYFKGDIPWNWEAELKKQGLWKEPTEQKGCPAP